MNIDPLLDAPAAVKLHLAAALSALVLGSVILLRTKGTAVHKVLGRIWAALMVLVAGGSFWIRGINEGRFSAIHLLSVFTLAMLGLALWHIRHGNVRGHRRAMIGTYLGGLVGAGLGALVPGRLLSKVLFGF
ncbi:MAG: DUF2306 domain-containing protein [Alphaproteobacteria bacterium]